MRTPTVPTKSGFLRWLFGALAIAACAPATGTAQTITVGAGGNYTTIQAAVNACPATGCIISLTDTVYKQAREVWIEGKNNLTIQAAANLQLAGIRPRIYYAAAASEFGVAGTAANPSDPERPTGWKKWPSSCAATAGGSKNTSNQYSTSGFQHNGLIVVYKSTNVRIEGVKLDGKSPQYFVNKGIWNCQWDVLFGNVGFNLFQSKNVVLRNNEMTNFFASIYMQNRNVGGAFAAPNPDDLDVKTIIPYSQFGKVGNHLIEKNYIHNNWWGFYDEMEWDIGSTIRYNILDSNFNTRYSQSSDSTSEANNMAGGFMYLKDVMIVPHKIYNNTMNGGVIVLGHGGFKPGIQHYFYNNLLTGWNRKDPKLVGMLKDFRQLMSKYKDFLYNNTFELGIDSAFQIQTMASEQIPDSLACAAAGQVGQKSCYLPFDSKVDVYTGIQLGKALWDGWNVAQGGYFTGYYKTKPYQIYNSQVVDVFGTNASGIIQKSQGVGNTQIDISSQANYWARNIKYKSIKPGAIGYMEPVWGDPTVDSTVLDKGWVAAGNRDQDGSMPDRGAIPQAKGALISPLTLKDQTIVKMSAGSSAATKKVTFDYCLDGTGSWMNLQLEMKNYYKQVGRRSIDPATGNDKDPWIEFSAPAVMQPSSPGPILNKCNTFTAEVATPVDSFARFELIVKGDLNGQTVRSNVGVWIWRKTQYVLDVYFTKHGGTAKDTVTSIRVGEPVDLRVKALRTDGTAVTLPIDVLTASPDVVTIMVNGNKVIAQGDTVSRNVPAKGDSIPVYFTSTGSASIAMSGMIGVLPVPGGASIMVRPGLPEKVEWTTPLSYKFVDKTLGLDSAAAVIPQSPTQVSLQVKDKWGNNVDTTGTISIKGLKIDPLITDLAFAPSAAGPFTGGPSGPWTFAFDATGKVSPFILAKGVQGQKFWGIANVMGKDSLDSALMKLGTQMERLYFTPVVAIDTFVTVRRKVHVILSEDGTTPKISSAMIQIRSKFGTKFYASATSLSPLDSIALTNGEADIWVTSDVPLSLDTLSAFSTLIASGMPTTYAPVSFRMPPVPPSPVPDTAAFLDLNCDGKADVARLWLKATATAPAALDTTAVKPEQILVTYANGVVDTIGATGWSAVGGNLAVLDLSLAKAPAITNPTGTLSMTVRLRRPPAADTIVAVGTSIAVKDRVAPRPTSGAIIENFKPGIVDDTVRVSFSEPVVFAGTVWPFQTREVPAGTIVNTAGITVSPMAATPSTTLTFVIQGNATGIIHAGQSIAIDSNAFLVDISSNHGKAGECLGDTAVLALVAQPVPMVASWIKDVDGDGSADRLTVVFKRALRAVDVPDSFVVAWGGVQRVVNLSTATTTDSTTWTIQLAMPFPKGITSGGGIAGAGVLTLKDGIGASARNDVIAIADSVAPIPVAAALSYGFDGVGDTLVVTYSEPMTIVATGSSWMLDQRLSDAPIGTAVGTAVGTDGLKIRFLVDPANPNYPRAGDSIRLPAGAVSKLVDAQGILPSTPTSPYVAIVAPPVPMVRAAIVDVNGDGAADHVSAVFLRALRPSDLADSLVLTWGTETRTVRMAGASTSDSIVWAFDLAVPFTKGVTQGGGANGAGIVTLHRGSALTNSAIPVALADSVAPIPLSARLAYGNGGAQDTLVVTYSEPLARKAGTAWMLDQQASDAPVGILAGTVASSDAVWNLFIDASTAVYPRPGDSIRLPSGVASNFADMRGILPTSPKSPYVVVVGPPIKLVAASLRDSDGDGRADQATVRFQKPLRPIDIPDSLVLTWGAESRAIPVAGATTVDSITWTISVANPFAKGVTIGGLADGAGSILLRKDVAGSVSRSETSSLADSVAPIPTSAELRYGPANGTDTLIVRYSEALTRNITGTNWMLNQRGGDVPVGTLGVPTADASVWNILVDPKGAGFARPGDSIRLPSAGASWLADARGVLPTSPKSPYVMVVGGDRPPMSAWYLDQNGDGRVDRAILVFSEALATNPTYVLQWGTETRSADTANYGGAAIGKTRLEIALTEPFALGVTASSLSFGVQTSSMAGASPSISTFPIADSVPPVILTARVGYTDYAQPGEKDTLFLKFSEPVRILGKTPVLGRGKDGNAYIIGYADPSADLLPISGDSVLFFCDTNCVTSLTTAGMPGNGDSIRITMPQLGISVTDTLGNAPGADAKWTRVTAGDRPYLYNVSIYPHGVLIEDKDFVPNISIKSKDPLSTWIFKDGKWYEFKNGQLTGESYDATKGDAIGVLEQNIVGIKIDINGAFDATLMIYDNLGTFIGTTSIVIDSALAKVYGDNAGKFKVLIGFNGRTGGPDKIAASGVYLIRYLTFRNELQPNGTRQRGVLENKVYKLGRKGSEK